jgi:hypothetical protein
VEQAQPFHRRNHVDYVHFNPVKHGYVTRPGDWPWGSFGQRHGGVDGIRRRGELEPENLRGMGVE